MRPLVDRYSRHFFGELQARIMGQLAEMNVVRVRSWIVIGSISAL